MKQIVTTQYLRNARNLTTQTTTYGASTPIQGTNDFLVRTTSRSVSRTSPPLQVDFVVSSSRPNTPYRVVDVVTEGSSLVANWSHDFHRFLTTPGQGYSYLVQKLNRKIAAPVQQTTVQNTTLASLTTTGTASPTSTGRGLDE